MAGRCSLSPLLVSAAGELNCSNVKSGGAQGGDETSKHRIQKEKIENLSNVTNVTCAADCPDPRHD